MQRRRQNQEERRSRDEAEAILRGYKGTYVAKDGTGGDGASAASSAGTVDIDASGAADARGFFRNAELGPDGVPVAPPPGTSRIWKRPGGGTVSPSVSWDPDDNVGSSSICALDSEEEKKTEEAEEIPVEEELEVKAPSLPISSGEGGEKSRAQPSWLPP